MTKHKIMKVRLDENPDDIFYFIHFAGKNLWKRYDSLEEGKLAIKRWNRLEKESNNLNQYP